jgi:RNA polymerase sigma-70 factor (ECF subfamily)
MRGSGQRGDDGRAVVYCVIPGELAPRLHEALRRHFRSDPGVEVIVERRGEERRETTDRRVDVETAARFRRDRRQLRRPAGRRVAERRAQLLAIDGPPLPRRVGPHAPRILFVERLEPSSQALEDADSARLVNRIQAGDRDGFAVLYMRYFDRVYGYLRLVYRNQGDAEDAAQQVFLKAFEGLPAFEGRTGPFRGWLFVIARNHAIGELRRRRPTLSLDDSPEPPDLSNGEGPLPVLDWISDRELNLFIERLPLAQRQVLFLRYVVGMSMREIAQTLGVSGETARQHHTRALRFLRRRLSAIGRAPRGEKQVGAEIVFRAAPVLRTRRWSLLAPR